MKLAISFLISFYVVMILLLVLNIVSLTFTGHPLEILDFVFADKSVKAAEVWSTVLIIFLLTLAVAFSRELKS